MLENSRDSRRSRCWCVGIKGLGAVLPGVKRLGLKYDPDMANRIGEFDYTVICRVKSRPMKSDLGVCGFSQHYKE